MNESLRRNRMKDGKAIIYCEGFYNTSWGKTAHGLVRFTRRYDITGLIDSRYAGQDAGQVLDGKPAGIPIYASIDQALKEHGDTTHLVFGVATDGGVLPESMRSDILHAVKLGLHVDCGLHYFLSEDPEFSSAARESGSVLRDVRKTPARGDLHPFTGRIKEVKSFRIALLGTDSSVGKRTTAWRLVDAFNAMDLDAEFIGTGQTAWLQGSQYGVIMDSLINDFVAGEIEHAILRAWDEKRPKVMVIEGQGSLMNPLYPGGFEILSAGQPHAVVLQHAPMRVDYDGLEDTPIHPLTVQIQAIELLSGKPVAAITVNHEQIPEDQIDSWCSTIAGQTGLPTQDALKHDLKPIVEALTKLMGDI
jgi:uncharacterized NAD-dependent epimerase/dehydratase family protein